MQIEPWYWGGGGKEEGRGGGEKKEGEGRGKHFHTSSFFFSSPFPWLLNISPLLALTGGELLTGMSDSEATR
jgi:hypothetical protein